MTGFDLLAGHVRKSRFVAVEGVQGAGKSSVIREILQRLPRGAAISDSLLEDDVLDDPSLGQATYVLQDAMKWALAQRHLAQGECVLVERFTLSREVFWWLHPSLADGARQLAKAAEELDLLGCAALYVVVDRPLDALRLEDERRGWRTPVEKLEAERAAYLDEEFVARATRGAPVLRYSYE
jgi:thymidylate kinase